MKVVEEVDVVVRGTVKGLSWVEPKPEWEIDGLVGWEVEGFSDEEEEVEAEAETEEGCFR